MTTSDLFGAARGVYAAVDPFAAHSHEGQHLARRTLMCLLGPSALPDRRLDAARKPLHMEISVHREGKRLVAHFHNNKKPSAASSTPGKSCPCMMLPLMCASVARHGASWSCLDPATADRVEVPPGPLPLHLASPGSAGHRGHRINAGWTPG